MEENWKFNENLLMGWCESRISLAFKWFLTFTPPRLQIFIEFSPFTDFLLTVCTGKEWEFGNQRNLNDLCYCCANSQGCIMPEILQPLRAKTCEKWFFVHFCNGICTALKTFFYFLNPCCESNKKLLIFYILTNAIFEMITYMVRPNILPK